MIKLIATDVDGTLTDGGLYVDGQGGEYKKFNVKDGLGLRAFIKAGGLVAVISGRYSAATERRAKELGLIILQNGPGNKLKTLQDFCALRGIEASEVCYVGDDINDLEPARWVGFSVAVADAHPWLKEVVSWVTPQAGGEGALRAVTDRLLEKEGGLYEAENP